MRFNQLQNRESGVSLEGHLSDSEDQKVFIGTSERRRHFARWNECGTVSSDKCLLIFLSDVLTNSIAGYSGSWLDFRELGRRLEPVLSSIRKCIRLKTCAIGEVTDTQPYKKSHTLVYWESKSSWFVFHLWQPFSRNKFKKNATSEIACYHLL
jgi:hypothetical protein